MRPAADIMRRFMVIAFVLLAGVTALTLILAVRRSPPALNVAVTLLGFTNDAAGGSIARFAVTNAGADPVIRHVG
jgi:hypothetical protein